MAEVHRVPLRRPPSHNFVPATGVLFAAFVTTLILKPWQAGVPPAEVTALPTFVFVTEPSRDPALRNYDPRLFGGREPDPAWELWPAGYVVEFGMAGPVDVPDPDHLVSVAPSAMPSDAPPRSPWASAEPTTSGAPATAMPIRRSINLGPADHLVALGINTPLDAGVERIELWRADRRVVPLIRLETPWHSLHFFVIAPEDSEVPGGVGAWAPGVYQLDLTTVSGEIREVMLEVRPPIG